MAADLDLESWKVAVEASLEWDRRPPGTGRRSDLGGRCS